MKKGFKSNLFILCVLMFTLSIASCAGDTRPIVSTEKVTYIGTDNGQVLHNPLMGWSYYAFPWEIIRYGIPDEFDVGYILCSWDQIEKTQGEYDFDLVTRAVNRLRLDGKTVYLRLYLMPDDVWQIEGYPAWLKDVEGIGEFFQSSIRTNNRDYYFWHPDYSNKTYQGLVLKFLKEVRKEYPDGLVDIIDLRCYGLYGEWDSDWGNYFTDKYKDYNSREVEAIKEQTLNELVDLYKEAFGDYARTKIAINVPSSGFDSEEQHNRYFEVAGYKNAFEAGFAIRYDAFDNTIPQRLFIRRVVNNYFPASPVFGETNYGWNLNMLNVEAVLSSFHQLRANIATFGFYRGNYKNALAYNPNFFSDTLKPDSSGNCIGYRILPTVIQYNKEANTGGKIHFYSQWENVGVGVLYNQYYLGLSLTDSQGNEVYFAIRDNFDITRLVKGGDPYVFSTSFNLPKANKLPAGTYDVRIALVDPTNNYKSSIAMPIDGDDGKLNYKIGQITLK